MKHKYAKWYADWRDEHGKRHAKAFPSKQKARSFGAKMRAEANAKKPQRPAPPSAKSHGRSARRPRAAASASSRAK